jgi:hypothetical protein
LEQQWKIWAVPRTTLFKQKNSFPVEFARAFCTTFGYNV